LKRVLAILPLLLAGACTPVLSPASEAAQLHLRDTGDEPAMRAHAWAAFAAATRAGPEGAPAFARWHGLGETFGGAAGFRRVEDFATGRPVLQAGGAPMLSLVLFDEPTFRHIRARHLDRRATLERLNAGFAADAPPERREIAAFPRAAVAIKTVWALVHAAGVTPLSVWDGAGAGAPDAWPRIVLVDPTGARGVPLAHFHYIRIGAPDLAAVRAIDPSARAGDYAVLVAMHLTTKEIPDWIWATYWWHDRAEAGPYAAQRPAAVTGVWRNYLMDVAYSAQTPREPDGGANIAFNPYLETFVGGHQSNCLACHQGAVWRRGGAPPFLPVTRGARAAGDPRFRDATRLDFMWSIALEAR
jgi:hypothetical protein